MKTILFIEDEPILQKALGSTLSAAGYKILQAFDGDAGLLMAKKEKPDLVLLDLVLPRKHGLEVLKELKEDQKTLSIPVIVLTNLEGTEDVMQALELGAKTYLVKANYSIKDVLEKIREALS